jgi:acetyl esterase/lipase
MRRLIFLAGIVGAIVLAGRRRHRRLAVVAPELRHRRLYLPSTPLNDISLRIRRRRLPTAAQHIAEGIEVRTEHVPADSEHPAVRVLIHESTDRLRPTGALVWIHGGAFVMGSAEQSRELCNRFAIELGIVVINVDYRLAPEHPFPAALADCTVVLDWVAEHADRLGVTRTHIAVGGDSAGGGLAACLAQLALDRGGPPICFQLLQYPMLDDRTALRTDHNTIVWTNASNRYAWSAYLAHPVTENEPRPYASAARRDDLTGLPSAWIGVGSIDLFHDESVDYAKRLRAAGVPCALHVVPGMFHAAEHVAPTAPSMSEFLDKMSAALRSALQPADTTSIET